MAIRVKATTTKIGRGAGTGRYKVYHTIGNVKYNVSANAHAIGGHAFICVVVDRQPYHVEILIVDVAGSSRDNVGFDITFFGNN